MFVLQQKKGTSSTAVKSSLKVSPLKATTVKASPLKATTVKESPLKETPVKESPVKQATCPESGAKIHKGKSALDKTEQPASSKPGNEFVLCYSEER